MLYCIESTILVVLYKTNPLKLAMMKTLVISVSFASAGYECLRDAYLIGSDRSSLVQTSSNSYEFSKDATFYGDPLDETIVPVLERCGIEFVILDCISSVRKF